MLAIDYLASRFTNSRLNRVWSTVENCQLSRYRCKRNNLPTCCAWVQRYGCDYQFECPELMCQSNVIFIWCRALIDWWSYAKFSHQFVCFCLNYIHLAVLHVDWGMRMCIKSATIQLYWITPIARDIACHHHHQSSLCEVWNVVATFNKPQRNKIASNFHAEFAGAHVSDFMAWHFDAPGLVSERTRDMAAHKL